MKPFFYILLPLTLFLVLAIWTQGLLQRDAEKMAHTIENITVSVKAEDWDSAASLMREVEVLWTPSRKKWKALVDHLEVDRIEISLTRVNEWILLQKKADCLVELAVLKQMILHIPEKERLIWSNIF